MLEAAAVDGSLSVLQGSQQGGLLDGVDISRVLGWIGDHLRPQQLQALSLLAVFRWALVQWQQSSTNVLVVLRES